MEMKSLVSVLLILSVLAGCKPEAPAVQLSFNPEASMEGSFVRFYETVEHTSSPSMASMGLPVDPGRVINLEDVLYHAGLSSTPGGLLENGFIVIPMAHPTDNPVLAFGRLENTGLPVFVSSGIPLHLLHIFFGQILQQVETDYLSQDLTAVCTALYESSLTRNDLTAAAYFAVPLTFLVNGFTPDSRITDTVEGETALMRAHAGFSRSLVFDYDEDFSQYVPRGHYTSSPLLENYFMAMMYLGRMTFPLQGGSPHGSAGNFLVSAEEAERLTRSALMIVSDLNTLEADGKPLFEKWKRICDITSFFAGFADDLGVLQYQEAAAAAAGSHAVSSDAIGSDDFRKGFLEYIAENFAGSAIYGGTGSSTAMPEENGEFSPGELQGVLEKNAGFRLFGQRYTPDSEMLGKFVFPSIGSNGSGERRFMPSGLDVAGAFNSRAALDILIENGTTGYAFYPDTMASMQAMVHAYSPDDWHETLYMSWLHALKLLTAPREQGYPDFMQTAQWSRCTLSTFLASWAMLRHDTILYAKQSYTMEAGCAFPGDDWQEPVPSAGFVEPVPEVYAQLRATLLMAANGLAHYGILDDNLQIRFASAENLLGRLQSIAQRQLQGELLTSGDADFLKGFAVSLENAITLGETTTEGLETSLIADVHTDQNTSSVLEVASGNLDHCLVIYMRADGVVEAALGPVLSYYEFHWPMADRLTDRAWREMLRSNSQAMPEWTEGYMYSPASEGF
jgi:hypothetical protein